MLLLSIISVSSSMVILFGSYILVAKKTFEYLARRDYYSEANSYKNFSFPKKTFLISAFWIIGIPLLLFKKFLKRKKDMLSYYYIKYLEDEIEKRRKNEER